MCPLGTNSSLASKKCTPLWERGRRRAIVASLATPARNRSAGCDDERFISPKECRRHSEIEFTLRYTYNRTAVCTQAYRSMHIFAPQCKKKSYVTQNRHIAKNKIKTNRGVPPHRWQSAPLQESCGPNRGSEHFAA